MKTYSGADVGSDHNPVLMQIKIKLKKMRERKSPVRLELLICKARTTTKRSRKKTRVQCYGEEQV